MGLTGAGGALVSLPLFVHALGNSVYVATGLGLIAVFFGALVNVWSQRNKVRWKWTAALVPTSIATSYAIRPLKAVLSDDWLALLISCIAIWSLISIWKPTGKAKIVSEEKSTRLWTRAMGIGLSVGALNTLTGLGGGVILVPALIRSMSLTQEAAVATSLSTIVFASAGSMFAQGIEIPAWLNLALLGFGIAIGVAAVSIISRNLNSQSMSQLRRWSFSLVVVGTIVGLFWK